MATAAKSAKRQPRKKKGAEPEVATVALPALADEHLDIPTLEQWLWDAACAIRGAADAPKFKDFILPLVFFKRLSDVFDDEFAGQVVEFGDEEIAREVIKADHDDALKNNRKPIVRFFIPHEYRWDAVRNHAADGTLGQFVTDAMREVAKLNPELLGVLDIKDYNERQSGQRTLDDDRLSALIEVVSRHRLGLKNAEPDILGRAYEYLLRKFAEGQGQSAGEFYTPKEVGWLMAHLLDPKPYTTVYDPTQQALLEFEKLAQEATEADAERQKLGLDENTFAIHKAVSVVSPGFNGDESKALNALFEAHPDFRWNRQQENQLRTELYKTLRPLVGTGKMIEVVNRILKLQRV